MHDYNYQSRLDPETAANARVEVLRREMGEELFAQYRKMTLETVKHTQEGEAIPGRMKCRAGQSSFVINWQGQMRSCVVLDNPGISLQETSFSDAWTQIVKGVEELRTSTKCSCSHCRNRNCQWRTRISLSIYEGNHKLFRKDLNT